MNTELSSTDWAYLAGFIDGEGCISSHPGNGKNPEHTRWRPMLSIQQADSVSLVTLHELFDVGRFHIKKHTQKSGRVDCQGRWVVMKPDDLRWLLEGVLPYSRLKHRQVEVALELIGGTTNRSKVIELSSLKNPNRVTNDA